MKTDFFSGLAKKAAAHKVITSVVILVVLAGLCAGGWFGFKEYERRQTAAFAVEKLKGALMASDAASLAHMVEFGRLSSGVAKSVRDAFPFFLAGPEQERDISQHLQTGLLRVLKDPAKKGSMFPDDESERKKLEKPLEFLPPDFVEQLAQNMQVRDMGPGAAIITTKIDHPQLAGSFPLVLNMQKTGDGWKIYELSNSGELLQMLRGAMLKRYTDLREVVEKKNEETTRQMNAALPLDSCAADVGPIDNGKMTLLVIRAQGRNQGDTQINNFNLDVTITDRQGNVALERLLNAAAPLEPGAKFDKRWTMELDGSDPLARTLLAGAPLRCQASWKTLSFAKPKVLHIEEVPHPDINCSRPGHDHPEGFCELPVFRR